MADLAGVLEPALRPYNPHNPIPAVDETPTWPIRIGSEDYLIEEERRDCPQGWLRRFLLAQFTRCRSAGPPPRPPTRHVRVRGP